MWQKLLNLAMESSGGRRQDLPVGGSGAHNEHDTDARAPQGSPGKRVTFFGNGNSNGRGGAPFTDANDNASKGSFSCGDAGNGNAVRAFSCDGTGEGTATGGNAVSFNSTGLNTGCVNKDDRRSFEVFARLWALCVGDDTCGKFDHTTGSILSDVPNGGGGGGGEGGDREYGGDGGYDDTTFAGMADKSIAFGSPRPQQQHPSSSSSSISGTPWERLVVALLSRGVDASHVLTAHEYTLLKRELADWYRGSERDDAGQGQGMTDRLAAAAAAALQPVGDHEAVITTTGGRCPSSTAALLNATGSNCRKNMKTTDIVDASCCNGGNNKNATNAITGAAYYNSGKQNKSTADVTGNNHEVGDVSDGAPKKLSFGGFEYPWVVEEGPSSSSSSAIGKTQANEKESAVEGLQPNDKRSRTMPAASAASGAVGANKANRETPLDLRRVALEAHEVKIGVLLLLLSSEFLRFC